MGLRAEIACEASIPEVVYSEERRNSAAISENANDTVRQREYQQPRIPNGLRCRPALAQLFLGGLMPGQRVSSSGTRRRLVR